MEDLGEWKSPNHAFPRPQRQKPPADMAATEPSKIPLVMGDDPEPNYNWFGDFDYAWFQNSGTFSSVPYFESVPDQLDELVETSAARRPLRLGFGPNECTTVSGSRNCTEACSDPSFLFTPANLGACTTLASAALLVQNGTYAVNQSDAETIATTDSWHIPDLSTFNATGVLESLVACIPESCTVSKLGECTDDVENISGVEIRPENLALISSKLGHYCDNTNLETNPDIAGPGVGFLFGTEGRVRIPLTSRGVRSLRLCSHTSCRRASPSYSTCYLKSRRRGPADSISSWSVSVRTVLADFERG